MENCGGSGDNPPFRSQLRRCSIENSLRVNDRIRASVVLVIDESGEKLGERPLEEALGLARGRGLDLVEIVPDRTPPVCKIMNHGRFVYQQSKKLQENRRNQRQNQVKEVKFRIIIGEHDRETKMRQITRFLHEGHKVKATIWFKRARERSHREIGDRILDEVTEALSEVATVESRSNIVGNQMSMILSPVRRLLDALRTERAGREEGAPARGRRGPREAEDAPSRGAAPPEGGVVSGGEGVPVEPEAAVAAGVETR